MFFPLSTHSRVDVVGRWQHVPRPERFGAGGAHKAPAVPAVVPSLEHVAERGVAHGAPENVHRPKEEAARVITTKKNQQFSTHKVNTNVVYLVCVYIKSTCLMDIPGKLQT